MGRDINVYSMTSFYVIGHDKARALMSMVDEDICEGWLEGMCMLEGHLGLLQNLLVPGKIDFHFESVILNLIFVDDSISFMLCFLFT